MRSSAFVVAIAFLASFVAVSQSGVINQPLDGVASYSLIDPIIKAILESIKPKLANMKIKDINQTIASPRFNASVNATDMQIVNLDKFNTQVLKSNLVPLKLTNLTLTWKEISASGSYNVNVNMSTPNSNPLNIFGKGKAKVTLNGVFVTIGANMELKDKAIQVKPKGFFGFDFYISKANVTLTSLMGSNELGNTVSVFLSKALPELVNALKKPVFDALHDDLVKIVNQILKNNGTTLSDEQPEIAFEGLDLSDELYDSFEQPLDFDLEDNEFGTEF